MSQDKELTEYIRAAQAWETSKVKEADRSRVIAWRIAIVSVLLTGMLIMAITVLIPLKEQVPFIIRVDNTTGVVDTVSTLKAGKTDYGDAMNKYFAQWYVRYREGYTRDLAPVYYTYVGMMSSPTEQQKYYQWFNPKNPESPLVIYGAGAKVSVQILSTSFIAQNIALVRYVKEVRRGVEQPEIKHWAATITFTYTKAPMEEKERAINPLGFIVTDYRNDPESVATTATEDINTRQ